MCRSNYQTKKTPEQVRAGHVRQFEKIVQAANAIANAFVKVNPRLRK